MEKDLNAIASTLLGGENVTPPVVPAVVSPTVSAPEPVNPPAPRYKNDGFEIKDVLGVSGDYSRVKVDNATWEHTVALDNAQPKLAFTRVKVTGGKTAWLFKFNVNGKDVDLLTKKVPVEGKKFKDVAFFVKTTEVDAFKASGPTYNL